MRHLDIHILQSVPVSCLNRDDFGSPKTAMFGNAQRARVSSQCWKSATRKMMTEVAPSLFRGERTRFILAPLRDRLVALGCDENAASEGATRLAEAINKIDTSNPNRVKTLFFTSPLELDRLATAYASNLATLKDAGKAAAKAVRELNKTALSDAADVAIFGRMVASDKTLTIEGAAMFGHALSTHRVANELDFFAAVDELQPDDETGAAITGTLEFVSATYYRFAALNLDLLEKHLDIMTAEERQNVVRHFVSAVLLSMPVARRNSMNGNTLPAYVLLVVRDSGHPLQLVNAFEEPVWTRGGLVQESIVKMEHEYKVMKEIWGLDATLECRIRTVQLTEEQEAGIPGGTVSLHTALEEVVKHVR